MSRSSAVTANSDAAAVSLPQEQVGLVRAAILILLLDNALTDDQIRLEYNVRAADPAYPRVTGQRLRSERARLVREGIVREASVLAFSDLGHRAAAWELT